MMGRAARPDTEADRELRANLVGSTRRSFVVVAGAGSGKTTSLVKALEEVVVTQGDALRRDGGRVACVTYTEVAAAEIAGDVGHPDVVHVSTIHSFLWLLVRPFAADISDWVARRIESELAERTTRIEKKGTRAPTVVKLRAEMEQLRQHSAHLTEIKRWRYGTGSDYRNGVLGHSDIVTMVPSLILTQPLLARLVAQRFPFIFVDESQDTFPDVVAALKHVQAENLERFCVGFFGDPMQQIFATGVGTIEPEADWLRINKPENFRSSAAVLRVVNAVRAPADGLVQGSGQPNVSQGSASVFILPADDQRRSRLDSLRSYLCRHGWSTETDENTRILVIVHRMAATRLGFGGLFGATHDKVPHSVPDAVDNGEYWLFRAITRYLLPLAAASAQGRDFEVVRLLRRNCPLLAQPNVGSLPMTKVLDGLADAVSRLAAMVATGSPASIGEVLRFARESGLAAFEPRLDLLLTTGVPGPSVGDQGESQAEDETEAVEQILKCKACELVAYEQYIQGQSAYSTQHGVKGAEFEQVIVVLDDEEGSYSLYSYEKFLGLKDLSAKDRENIDGGRDSVLGRTRRLFYVCCSRAKLRLAVALFSSNCEEAAARLRESGLCAPEDVMVFDET